MDKYDFSNIKVGDSVFEYDCESERLVLKTVTNVYKKTFKVDRYGFLYNLSDGYMKNKSSICFYKCIPYNEENKLRYEKQQLRDKIISQLHFIERNISFYNNDTLTEINNFLKKCVY